MVLFIDACARPQSRTRYLAKRALRKISEEYQRLDIIKENLKPLDFDTLSAREENIIKADFSDDSFHYAKQFRDADEIVIAAPYWDLSFPAALKCYIENICVNGITFIYNEQGIPQGLCNAKRLIYVTTAGGFIPGDNYGYNYINKLCADFFGIKNTVYIKAEGLDIYGADVKGIIKKAEDEIDAL